MTDLLWEPPGVSVIIPHFNASDTLARALDSVSAQTWRVAEVIVVDDASDAAERGEAEAIIAAHVDARIIALERNAGPANARNVGWDAARAPWIAFLDSDDAWHPRKIEVQLTEAARSSPTPAMIASRTVRVNDVAELQATALHAPFRTSTITKAHLLLRNRMSTPSVVVRRDLPLRFAAGRRFSEDYELWLTIAGKEHWILLVDEPLAAIFKPPYGASGLSSNMWRMIGGEYLAYIGAWRSGALSVLELVAGLASSTARSMLRLVKLLVRRDRRLQ